MNDITFYSFFNYILEEEFKFVFLIRREHLCDHVLIKEIRREICSSNWDEEHHIIGEPKDPSFPIIEFSCDSIKIIEKTCFAYTPNALSFQLDSMKI